MAPFDIRVDGSLVLTLDGCCLQTAARRAHRVLVAALLGPRGSQPALGELAALLERFVGATDFAALRAGHPRLTGSPPCRVRLYGHADGSVRWEIVSVPWEIVEPA